LGGRPKGIRNKSTLSVGEFFRGVFESDDYRQRVTKRLIDGKAPHLETIGFYYAYGKPKETLDINITQTMLLAALRLSDLELTAFLRALESPQPEQALQLLPGEVA
jgi:hypothetical protein